MLDHTPLSRGSSSAWVVNRARVGRGFWRFLFGKTSSPRRRELSRRNPAPLNNSRSPEPHRLRRECDIESPSRRPARRVKFACVMRSPDQTRTRPAARVRFGFTAAGSGLRSGDRGATPPGQSFISPRFRAASFSPWPAGTWGPSFFAPSAGTATSASPSARSGDVWFWRSGRHGTMPHLLGDCENRRGCRAGSGQEGWERADDE